MSYTRREFLRSATAGAAALLVADNAFAALPAPIAITVYKDKNCGCCKEWVKHLTANGFTAQAHDLSESAMSETKNTLGVPNELRSCHTAVIGRYFVEGHVPADVIKKLHTQKPSNILGLAVPGMPVGSPGMEVGSRKDPYDVFAWTWDKKRTVYASPVVAR